MSIHIVVNRKEITNPVLKLFIMLSVILAAGLLTAIFLLLVLPLIGITVAATFGFALIVAVSIGGVLALGLCAALVSLVAGPVEVLINKSRQK